MPLLERADLLEARLLQILFNIFSSLVSRSRSLSTRKELFTVKLPEALLVILKAELSYPPVKQDLVHMTALLTLTAIVKEYADSVLEFCNPLFDLSYARLQLAAPQYVHNACISCITVMVESIKDFMEGRLTPIF